MQSAACLKYVQHTLEEVLTLELEMVEFTTTAHARILSVKIA